VSHPDIDAAAGTLVRRLTQQLATTRQRHREQVAELRTALEAAHGELLELRRQLHNKQLHNKQLHNNR
jgi:thioredoxin-like negative regulator of GroEL